MLRWSQIQIRIEETHLAQRWTMGVKHCRSFMGAVGARGRKKSNMKNMNIENGAVRPPRLILVDFVEDSGTLSISSEDLGVYV